MVTAPDGSEVRRVQFSHLSLADGRRALKGITVTSGNDTLDRHDFIYKNFGGNQPGDFFGFCNGTGSTGSKSVIDPNTGRFNSTRRYNPRTAAHGAMARHTTLTGARTDFEYEPNTLLLPRLNDSVQIGVRIKSITTTDMVCGRTQTRRYFYARPVCSIDFTQVDITPFVSLSGMSWLKTNEGRPTTTECHNVSAATLRSSRLPGAPLSSARIYYGEAAEEITGTGLEKPVRTEYEYDTSRCQLKRVGGGGNVNNSNPYFIRGDMTIPTTRTDPSVKRLFATGFADHYFAECNYAEPRLRVRRQMQWVNGAYHPLEEKEYFHSLVDSAAYRTGLHVEPLVKDVRNVYGSVKTAYKNTGDLVYFQTALLSGRWRLDSVAERRWHGTGPDAVVAHSGTRYRYTRRRTPVTGECVPWAQPASTVIPLPDMNPGGLTITGIGGDKVFGDSVSMTCDHEMLVGTVTTAAGHKAEHHTAWSACVPGRTYAVKTLPVAEMWIVDGRDSLLKRYEYGKFRSLTRPTRISLGLKGRPAMAEQRCTAYSPHGLPLDCHRTGQPEERYEYDGDMVTKISTGPSGSQLVSAFTHVPLVGCSSLTTPWGYTERFGYSGSRLTSRRGGTANRILERWAYRHRRGPGSVNAIEHTSYAAGEAAVTTECFDGLGASVGEVLNGYGADGDVLTATRMDALGRATRIWSAVPVTDAETALCDDDDLASAAQTFHGDSCAFTTLSYPLSGETSPIATTLPGSGFAGHPSTVERVCSDPSRPELRVRRLTWDGTTLRASGHYRAGELQGTKATDADGVSVMTLSDALGRQVIRRAFGDDGVTADTYTVCDSWGNPLLVLQPMGSALLQDVGSWQQGSTVIDEYAFIYRYDDRLRVVSQKTPGCVPELTAYDARGLVAYTRTWATAATGRKMFHLYDDLCRPAVSGLCEDFYSDQDWERVHETPVARRRVLSGGVASHYTLTRDDLPPGALVTDTRYYDRYLPGMYYANAVQVPLGLQTAWRSAVLDGYGLSDSVTTVMHYSEEGHLLFSDRRWPANRRMLTTTTRTPGGLPLVSNTSLSGTGETVFLNTASVYDAFGRTVSRTAIGGRSHLLTLEENSYDGAGRLAASTAHGGLATAYAYDARGALASATNGLLDIEYGYASGQSAPSFAGRISAKTVKHRSGNIIAVKRHSYTYDSMGRLAQAALVNTANLIPTKPSLTAASPAAAGLPGILFPPPVFNLYTNSETFTYDLNANVLSITRYGLGAPGQHRKVDRLGMAYTGNRLTLLEDDADQVTLESSMDVPTGWYEDTALGYDPDGALTRDVSRNISHVSRYPNGMAHMVHAMSGETVTLEYTAAGEKLAETVWNGSRTSRREYIGPFELLDGRLERVNLPHGHIDSLGTFHAYIPDMQGNVMGVYEARQGDKQLEQYNEYYAYGGLTADSKGQAVNRRRYTGKELTTDFGLNTYDFSARRQYPMVGRFDSPDPLAHKTPWLSPYAFCGGDPINFSDPTGMDIWGINSKGEVEYHTEQKEYDQIVITDRLTEDSAPISASFEYGTLRRMIQHRVPNDAGSFGFTRLDVARGEAGLNAFSFLASNTDVEWGYLNIIEIGTYMTTSNEENSEGGSAHIATALGKNGYEISTHIHSHPSNTMEPSGMEVGATSGDVKFAQSLDFITGGGTKYYIFIPKNQSLVPYSSKSILSDFNEDKMIQIKWEDYIKTP